MMFNLIVTGRLFDELVDMDKATLYVEFPRCLSDPLKIGMKYVVLHTEGRDDMRDLAEFVGWDVSKSNISLGRCELEVTRPVSADLMVALYQSPENKTFLMGINKRPVTLHRKWGSDIDGADGYTYDLGSLLSWPYGNCELEIISNGPVSLTFEKSSVEKV